jgi:hypothetical protein
MSIPPLPPNTTSANLPSPLTESGRLEFERELSLIDASKSAGAAPKKAAPSWKSSSEQLSNFVGQPTTLTSSISRSGNTITGKGSVRNSPGAIMWIELVNTTTGQAYGTHIGNTVKVADLPPGNYVTDFYFGNGAGAVDSPAASIPTPTSPTPKPPYGKVGMVG